LLVDYPNRALRAGRGGCGRCAFQPNGHLFVLNEYDAVTVVLEQLRTFLFTGAVATAQIPIYSYAHFSTSRSGQLFPNILAQ
jgi:hypothetical protein